jgi:K+-transporting ATPase ATPase A chain
MLGLAVQNFVSAATGMAVVIALTRGLARPVGGHHRQLLGRSGARHALHLLPLSSILAVILVSQGVVQNFLP